MPRPVGFGRPGTRVIPAGWQQNQARVVAGTFDCKVSISPPGATRQWVEDDQGKRTQTLPAAPVYVGAASVTPMSSDDDQHTDVAQDVVPTRVYEVKVDRCENDVEVGHVVTVSEAPDASLLGRLTVTGVEMGSRRFSRVLTAVRAD